MEWHFAVVEMVKLPLDKALIGVELQIDMIGRVNGIAVKAG